MGSWNETCMLSHLPIQFGDDINQDCMYIKPDDDFLCVNTDCLQTHCQKVVSDLSHDVVQVANAAAFSHRKSLQNLF